MSFSPPIGAIAYGKSGVPCLVVEHHLDWVTLQRPDQSLINVIHSAIIRWEHCQIKAENQAEISSASSGNQDEALLQPIDLVFSSDKTIEQYRQHHVTKATVSSVVVTNVSGLVTARQEYRQKDADDTDDNPRLPKPNIYQPYPGSIATSVTDRVINVLKYTYPKSWTVWTVAKLPYLGGATVEQVRRVCKQLEVNRQAQSKVTGKQIQYCWADQQIVSA